MAVDTPTAEAPDGPAALRRQAVRGGALYLAARLAAQTFQWAVTLYIARLLLPEDYGLMTAGMLVLGLADMLAEAGFGAALIHKKDVSRADLAQAFTLSLALAFGLYALLFAAAAPIADHLGRPEFTRFLRVLALLLFLVPFQSVPMALLERGLQLGRQSAVMLAGALAQTGLVLALAMAGAGYWALAGGTLAGRCLQAGAVWYASGWRPRLAVPGHEAAELLSYGVNVTAAGLLWFAYSNADCAVLAFLFGTVTLGHYSVAYQMISLPVRKLSVNVNGVMFAVFCRLRDEPERIHGWFLRLTVLMTFVSAPALMGMALIADDAIPLVLGPQWVEAVLPFQLLAPVGVLMVVSSSLAPLFNALGRPDIIAKYTAACAALFPAGFLFFGWHFGLVGVCAVWLVLSPLLAASLVHLTRHVTGLTLPALLRAHCPVLAGVAFMTACVLVVQRAMPGDDSVALRLTAVIAAGAVSYAVWMLLTARAVLADLRGVGRELRGG